MKISNSGIAAALAALATVAPSASAGSRAGTTGWVAAWLAPAVRAAAPDYPVDVRTYAGQTVRQTLRLGAASARMRVQFTNALGTVPVQVGATHIALCDRGGRPLPGTDRTLSFNGRGAVTIAAGASAYSDAQSFTAPTFSEVEVSVFYPAMATPAAHLAQVTVEPGDRADGSGPAAAAPVRGPALAARVDVVRGGPVVVALGDSITEGPAQSPGRHLGWPEQLADRLARTPGASRVVVVNAGIGGNRLLHDGSAEGVGALARFDRDVLGVPGVQEVILLEGINDIGFGSQPEHAAEKVIAADLIAADRQLIARAHAHGIRIIAGTLTPFQGAAYYTEAGERTRQEMNAFIRSGAFDGVVDFDAALRDPAHPRVLLAAYARPDHLHPSNAGFARMAEAVPLKLLPTN